LTCTEAERALSAEGDAEPELAAALEDHLATCPACRAEREQTTRMVAGLRALGGRDLENPDAAFARIAGALDQDAVRRRKLRRVGFAAGISGTLAVAAGFLLMVGMRRHLRAPSLAQSDGATPTDDELLSQAQAELTAADDHYRQAIDTLRQIADRERERWPRALAASYAGDLASREDAVDRAAEEAAAHPDDPSRQAALAAAYQAQIDFLQGAIRDGELAELETTP
jgi:hypothetical protein